MGIGVDQTGILDVASSSLVFQSRANICLLVETLNVQFDLSLMDETDADGMDNRQTVVIKIHSTIELIPSSSSLMLFFD